MGALNGGCVLASCNIVGSDALLRARGVRSTVSTTTRGNNKIVIVPGKACLDKTLFFGPGARLRLRRKTILGKDSSVDGFPVVSAHVRKRDLGCFTTLIGTSGISNFALSKGNAVSNGKLEC